MNVLSALGQALEIRVNLDIFAVEAGLFWQEDDIKIHQMLFKIFKTKLQNLQMKWIGKNGGPPTFNQNRAKDVNDINDGEPLYGQFEPADWALLQLRSPALD